MKIGHGHTIDDARRGPHVLPLICWCLVQLAALCVAALRVPLAAKYPDPPELLAVHVMTVTQITAAALLFPDLLADWQTALAVIAAAWPFAALAAALAALSLHRVAPAEMYVTGWLIGLSLWRGVLRGPRASAHGIAVASAATIGGAIVWYLAIEFDPRVPVEGIGDPIGSFAPPVTVIRLLSTDALDWRDWLVPVSVLCTAAAALVVRRAGGRDRLSTTPARSQPE